MTSGKLSPDQVYAFAMRGLLTEQALENVGAKRRRVTQLGADETTAKALSVELIDEEFVASARKMAIVYTTIAAFENSVRDLVSDVMLENVGSDWWTKCVSRKIRDKAEGRRKEEERYRWHAQRGYEPLQYTDFGDLASIIQQNWQFFEPYMQSVGWVQNIFDTLERSRNVIMHSGELDDHDIDRIGIHIRDWVKQVG
jgi:hypothetical protein